MSLKQKLLREVSSGAMESSFEFESSVEFIQSWKREKASSFNQHGHQQNVGNDQQGFIKNDQHGLIINGQHGLSNNDQHGFMDQCVMPRPCYYSLRILGAWQPKNCHAVFKAYAAFSYVILLSSMATILGLECIHHQSFYSESSKEWKLGSIVNSCFTLLNLTCPFVFIKYYFRYGSYDQLLGSVFLSSFEHRGKVRSLSRAYSTFSLAVWFLSAAFFFIHWQPFFSEFWHYGLYAITVFYSTGWWAAWLSIYGFVCHVHSLQGQIFVENMQEKLQFSNRTRAEESRRLGILLGAYNDLNRWIERTQSEFGKIVSFAITYHVIDMVVFSVAYLDKDFGSSERYPLWQYIGGVTFDLASIAIKLYPAAIVSLAVHRVTQRAGSECYPHFMNVNMPEERFQFYQHLFIREQDIGLRILGVKISVRIAVGIFVTIVTALATFLRFVLVNLGSKYSLF